MDLATLVKTTNAVASGTAFKGFIWEDFNIRRTALLRDDRRQRVGSGDPAVVGLDRWKTKPVAAGTVAQLMPSDTAAVGGRLQRQPVPAESHDRAAVAKTFTVGGGTLSARSGIDGDGERALRGDQRTARSTRSR